MEASREATSAQAKALSFASAKNVMSIPQTPISGLCETITFALLTTRRLLWGVEVAVLASL